MTRRSCDLGRMQWAKLRPVRKPSRRSRLASRVRLRLCGSGATTPGLGVRLQVGKKIFSRGSKLMSWEIWSGWCLWSTRCRRQRLLLLYEDRQAASDVLRRIRQGPSCAEISLPSGLSTRHLRRPRSLPGQQLRADQAFARPPHFHARRTVELQKAAPPVPDKIKIEATEGMVCPEFAANSYKRPPLQCRIRSKSKRPRGWSARSSPQTREIRPKTSRLCHFAAEARA